MAEIQIKTLEVCAQVLNTTIDKSIRTLAFLENQISEPEHTRYLEQPLAEMVYQADNLKKALPDMLAALGDIEKKLANG